MTKIQQYRQDLKELSAKVKDLVAEKKFKSVNHALMTKFYKTAGNTEFKTLDGWNRDGYQVKKGSKPYVLWGKPEDMQGEGGAYTYFPLLFIFSNRQVIKQERRQQYAY